MLKPSIIQQLIGQALFGRGLAHHAIQSLSLVWLILLLGSSAAWGRDLGEIGCYGCHLGDADNGQEVAKRLTLSEFETRFRHRVSSTDH